jgi:DNA-binding transcriptional MerR regulator
MRAIDLGRSVGLSAQQIRNYEGHGLLPFVERQANGYRTYRHIHIVALAAVRAMLDAGWTQDHAIVVMHAIHAGDVGLAFAQVNERHARLDQQLRQVDRTLEAIRDMADESGTVSIGRHRQELRIGEAARVVGVAPSAVRFWEQQGLLLPRRDAESGYRLYDRAQLRRLHMTVLLREANYGFDAIHSVLDELSTGKPESSLRALELRRREIAVSSERCARATAAIVAYMDEAQRGVEGGEDIAKRL